MDPKRNIYLNMKTLEEARNISAETYCVANILETETVAVPTAVGRILAEPVHATISSPHFNAAAMDAYDQHGASAPHPPSEEAEKASKYLKEISETIEKSTANIKPRDI